MLSKTESSKKSSRSRFSLHRREQEAVYEQIKRFLSLKIFSLAITIVTKRKWKTSFLFLFRCCVCFYNFLVELLKNLILIIKIKQLFASLFADHKLFLVKKTVFVVVFFDKCAFPPPATFRSLCHCAISKDLRARVSEALEHLASSIRKKNIRQRRKLAMKLIKLTMNWKKNEQQITARSYN